MYPADHAAATPDKPAMIDVGTGAVLTYRQLEDDTNQFAQFLHRHGLRRGDHIAILLENRLEFCALCWAAMRSGLYVTAVNRYLTAAEVAYIVNDCGAQVVVTSATMAPVAQALGPLIPDVRIRLMLGGTLAGWDSYEAAVAPMPTDRLAEEWLGETMLYSSGTTGRPKGVKRSLVDAKVYETFRSLDNIRHYGIDSDTVYLSPAPLYHAAPLSYTLSTQLAGGTVIMMAKFDAETALALIERHRVTHSQWVPTMFVRLLKLPDAVRRRHDLSSHRVAIHAAAPCPPEAKRQMIEWWGPILHEYYAGTETNGITRIDSTEWLARPGSVGRAVLGIIHICDEAGHELRTGEAGLIYFQRDTMPFAYHNDPAKTAAAQHPVHKTWTTLGDIGHVDTEGYLYLTDRAAFMIISGGVNIYPRAIEDALLAHPAVADVAVFGIPDPDMGEQVKAVVEVQPGHTADDALKAALIAHVAQHLARYMVPKSVDFIDVLPRLPTGKLYKQALRDRYLTPAAIG